MASIKRANVVKTNTNDEVKKMGIILGVVVLIIAVFYIGTYLLTKKPSNKKEDTTIQYKEILVGNMLVKKDAEYYVLASKNDDQFLSLYSSYFTIYNKKEGSIPYYSVNLDNNFNKKYVCKTSNFVFDDIKDICFADTTLLKIKDGKIVESYIGHDSITAKMESIIK